MPKLWNESFYANSVHLHMPYMPQNLEEIMILTPQQIMELESVSLPVIKWLYSRSPFDNTVTSDKSRNA